MTFCCSLSLPSPPILSERIVLNPRLCCVAATHTGNITIMSRPLSTRDRQGKGKRVGGDGKVGWLGGWGGDGVEGEGEGGGGENLRMTQAKYKYMQ